MYKNSVYVISIALVLSLACASFAGTIVIGDFEEGLDGWELTYEAETKPGLAIDQSTTGATSGSRSLALTPHNGWAWAVQVPVDVQQYGTLMADISWVAAEWNPNDASIWVNFKEITVQSGNDDDNVSSEFIPSDPVNPDWPGSWDPGNWGDHTRTLTWDISSHVPAENHTWMKIIFSVNMGGGVITPGNYYIDNVRLTQSSPETVPDTSLGIVYVDATEGPEGNTILATGEVFQPLDDASGDDNLWRSRGYANGGTIFEAGGEISETANTEDCPRLVTMIEVPEAQYTVYAYFWADENSWSIRASIYNDEEQLPLYLANDPDTVATLANPDDFEGGVMTSESNRQMWQIELGTITTSLIEVYIDDDPYHLTHRWRTWYDGIGYKIVQNDDYPPNPSVSEILIIDDFEGYTDNLDEGEVIWQTWSDGLEDPQNGSQVGYFEPPFAELEFVHSGMQSMPVFYDNIEGVTESVVYRTFDTPMDWSDYEVFSMWIHGNSDNIVPETTQFYSGLEDTSEHTAFVPHYDPNILLSDSWQQWIFPTSEFAQQDVNIASVESLFIGLGNGDNAQTGGRGKCYFDDILIFKTNLTYQQEFWDTLPQPELIPLDTVAVIGESIYIEVINLAYFEPGIIYWDDGFTTEIQTDGVYSHVYNDTGEYNITVRTTAGITVLPVPAIIQAHPLPLSVDLNLLGTDIDGAPIEARAAQVERNTTNPPSLELVVTAQDVNVLNGSFVIETPTIIQRLPFEMVFNNSGQTIQTEIVTVSLTDTFSEYGSYTLSAEIKIGNKNNKQIAPLPVSVQVPKPVTEDDCKEIKKNYLRLVAEKNAKINKCRDIEKKIADLDRKIADAQKAIDELNKKKKNKQDELKDGPQNDFNPLFNSIKEFFRGAGTLVQYNNAADFPEGYSVGVRLRDNSSGIGFSFSDTDALLNRADLYEQSEGRSVGEDFMKLHKSISEMDSINKVIDGLNKEINKKQTEIDNLKAEKQKKQNELNQCKQECDKLQQDANDLAEAEKKCLEQLNKQQKAQDAIDNTRKNGNKAQKGANNVNKSATDADTTIDNHAGSPDEIDKDKQDVAKGRAKQGEAQRSIDQGNEKLEDAKKSLEEGDTEAATRLAEEADNLFKQAEEKLKDAENDIRSATARAKGRSARQCKDEEYKLGDVREWFVVTEIVEINLAASGKDPTEWKNALARAQKSMSGLKIFIKLIDFIKFALSGGPVESTLMPNAGEIVDDIFNAYVKLFANRYLPDVWAKVKGHTAWKRVDQICKNGLWVDLPVEGSDTKELTKEFCIGTIWDKGNKEEYKRKLNKLIQDMPMTIAE